MTAYVQPPAVIDGRIVRPGLLTEAVATRHAAVIKFELDSLEDFIAALPDGDLKTTLKHRTLRLHNALGRGGQALNAHFQTAQVSPDSAGGDKDGDGGQPSSS